MRRAVHCSRRTFPRRRAGGIALLAGLAGLCITAGAARAQKEDEGEAPPPLFEDLGEYPLTGGRASPAAAPDGVPASVSGPGDAPALEPEEFELSEERVITATRYEQKVAQAPAIVQIFPAKRFRDLGIETVADALRLLGGVHVRPWKTSQWTAIFRGTLSPDNNKFLLLVDGVPWRDGVYGWAWIDRYLTLSNVRQIEVIRGPGSAMYGSNAFAGVINVITLRGEHVRGIEAGAGVGSFWRHEYWANGGDVFDTPLGLADAIAYFRYFDEMGDGPPFSARDVRRIGARDPHKGISGGFRISLAGLSLKWDTVSYAHARFDGAVNTFRDIVGLNPTLFNYNYLNNFLDLRYDLDLPGGFHLQPRLLFQHYSNSGSYPKCSSSSKILGIVPEAPESIGSCPAIPDDPQWETVVEPVKETRRVGAGLEVQHEVRGTNRLVLGFEWESEQIREVEDAAYVGGTYIPGLEGYLIPHTPLSIDDIAFYGQDTLHPFAGIGLGFTLGARLGSHRIPRWNGQRQDFDTQTFNHFSPRIGLVYSFDREDRWVLKLLYGQAFRAPTARELLLESSGEWTSGDPTLEPEKIRTYEAELTLRPWRWLSWVTSGYANLVEDEIVEDGANKRYIRSEGFRVYGVDTELRLQGKSLEAMANFSLTDALDRGADRPQYGVPRYLAHGSLSYHLSSTLSATVVGHYVGSTPRAAWTADWQKPRPDGEAYTLLDLQLRARELFGGRLALTFAVHNLFGQPVTYILEKERGEKYTTDYQMDSRAFMVRLDGKL